MLSQVNAWSTPSQRNCWHQDTVVRWQPLLWIEIVRWLISWLNTFWQRWSVEGAWTIEILMRHKRCIFITYWITNIFIYTHWIKHISIPSSDIAVTLCLSNEELILDAKGSRNTGKCSDRAVLSYKRASIQHDRLLYFLFLLIQLGNEL